MTTRNDHHTEVLMSLLWIFWLAYTIFILSLSKSPVPRFLIIFPATLVTILLTKKILKNV